MFPDFQSLNFYLKIVNYKRNHPHREQSDRCIFEIFNDCKTSSACKEIENAKTQSFGYAATHK